MNTEIVSLLNKVKSKHKLTSNYQLAKQLKIPEPRICEYYKDKRRPDEYVLAKVALALDLPFGQILCQVRMEDDKTEERRDFWKSFSSRTGEVLKTLLPVLFTLFCSSASTDGNASEVAEAKTHNALLRKKKLALA